MSKYPYLSLLISGVFFLLSCGIDTTSIESESPTAFSVENELEAESTTQKLQKILDLLAEEGVPEDQRVEIAKETLAESLKGVWVEFNNETDTLNLIPNHYLLKVKSQDSLAVLECTSLLGPGIFEWQGEIMGQYVNLILLETRTDPYSLRIYEGEWLCVQKEFRKETE